jgi:hypothetical protein
MKEKGVGKFEPTGPGYPTPADFQPRRAAQRIDIGLAVTLQSEAAAKRTKHTKGTG